MLTEEKVSLASNAFSTEYVTDLQVSFHDNRVVGLKFTVEGKMEEWAFTYGSLRNAMRMGCKDAKVIGSNQS